MSGVSLYYFKRTQQKWLILFIYKEDVNFGALASVFFLQQECMHAVIMSVTRKRDSEPVS